MTASTPTEPVPNNTNHPTNRLVSVGFLLATVPIPILGTSAAMVWWPEATWPKALFFLAKLWLFAAPLVWLKWVAQSKPKLPKWSNRGMGWAHAWGAASFVVILAASFAVPIEWTRSTTMLEKVQAMHLDNAWLYGLGAIYWCTVNSLLEEYFWRWFVTGRLKDVLDPRGLWLAIVGSGVFFTLHHIVALHVYFNVPVTILGAIGVCGGGILWSAMYEKFGNIYTGYITHVYADLAIFGFGAWLIFGGG